MEYYNTVTKYTPPPMATCVRTESYKLAYWQTLGTGELYDRKRDPGEVNTLWNSSQHKDAQSMMLMQLTHRMIASTDPLGVHVL